MSLATASCDLWQNEQRSVSSGDLGFTSNSLKRRTLCSGQQSAFRIALLLMLIDNVVDYPIFLSLLRIHDEVTFYILLHLLQPLPGMPGQHLVGDFPHAQNLPCMYINICSLATKA